MLIVVKTLFAKVMKTNDPVTTLLELIPGSWYWGTPGWSIKCLSNTITGGVLWPGNRLGRPNYVPLSNSGFRDTMLVDKSWPYGELTPQKKGEYDRSRLSFQGQRLAINQNSTCPVLTSRIVLKSEINQPKIQSVFKTWVNIKWIYLVCMRDIKKMSASEWSNNDWRQIGETFKVRIT